MFEFYKRISPFLVPRRLLNIIKIFLSFYFSKFFKTPLLWGKPIHISIEPTTACNLRCPECPSGLRSFTRNTGNIHIDLFEKIIKSVSKHTTSLTLYFQGEPFLHKSLNDLIKIAKKENLYVITSTNGHFLTEENSYKIVKSGLDELIISMDGTDQSTYQKYRIEGSLDKVFEGIQNLNKAKKSINSKFPKITLQFIVVKHNEHQIDEVLAIGKKLNIDQVKLKSAQIYNFKNGSPLIPDNNKFSRYKLMPNGTYKIKSKLQNHCWKMWSSCVFTWDGEVLPCCFDKDAKYSSGNISTESFDKIWQNNKYQNFRKKILSHRNQIDICNNCTEGLKVFNDS